MVIKISWEATTVFTNGYINYTTHAMDIYTNLRTGAINRSVERDEVFCKKQAS